MDGVETWTGKVRVAASVGTWQLKGMLTLNLWGAFQRRQVGREESGTDGQKDERPRDKEKEKGKRASGCLSRLLETWKEALCSLPGSL